MSVEPKKILVVAPLGVGGVTSMMVNIQKHLDRSKINFDYLVYHDRKEPLEDVVLALGSNKLVASADEIKFRPIRRLVRMYRIAKLCRQKKIKEIHFNTGSPLEITNILAAKAGGVKHITIHSHNAGYSNATSVVVKITNELIKPLLPFVCNEFWACSDLAARFMFPKSIIKKKKYTVIPNGIELERFDYDESVRNKVRNELDLKDRFVVGHAGRFLHQKNHMFLIDIFVEISRKDPTAVLVLFGVGELVDSVKQKVKDYGLEDKVKFMGATNRMNEMWQAIDVFIMPSFHEGLPVAGIEAQASGLYPVFSDCITKEVDLSGNCTFLSLNDLPERWADCALSLKQIERKSGIPYLRRARYDIRQTADYFSDYYLSLD